MDELVSSQAIGLLDPSKCHLNTFWVEDLLDLTLVCDDGEIRRKEDRQYTSYLSQTQQTASVYFFLPGVKFSGLNVKIVHVLLQMLCNLY